MEAQDGNGQEIQSVPGHLNREKEALGVTEIDDKEFSLSSGVVLIVHGRSIILKKKFNLTLRQKFYLYFNIYVLGIQFKENNLITLSKDLAPETVCNIVCQPICIEQRLCNSHHCGTVIYFQINIEFTLSKFA